MSGLIKIDGFLLEAGVSLFKGDNKKYFDQYKREEIVTYDKHPAYFALEEEVSAQYGVIFEFIVVEPLFIVDLGDVDVVSTLYINASPKIQTILRKNYGYDPEHETITMRDSVHEKDNILSEYLCSIGVKGYVLNKQLETDLGGKFHREVMLCDPSTLEFSKLVGFSKDKKHIERRKPNDMDEKRIIDKMIEKKMKKEFEASRRKKRHSSEEDNEENSIPEQKMSINNNLFGNTPENSPLKFDSPHKTPSPSKKTKMMGFSYKTP